MNNDTLVNTSLSASQGTQVNTVLNNSGSAGATLINHLIENDEVLLGGYTVKKRIEVNSGEADLYLCSRDGTDYIAKVYKRSSAVKESVIESLKAINSPYVARLYDYGTDKNGRQIEILPYYKNGSLQGRKYTLEELRKTVIPCINDGLRALHDKRIIHKDLKPSNIMLNDDGKTVSIIDFGISSTIASENDIVVTKTGMTPEYSAPETFKNIYYDGSDYYSFGITLYELFCGYTPYANMQPDEIEKFVSIQKIPYPKEMPDSLKDLITALTYYDISNRNSDNPNKRWTYKEVSDWLAGVRRPVPGEGERKGVMPAFVFAGKTYTVPEELFAAMGKEWKEGKKRLFRGEITAHFRKCNPGVADMCSAAEEAAGRENGKDDIIYWSLLYRLNPKERSFVWMGRRFESLPAFGREVLERLWANDDTGFDYYESVLREKLLSQFALLTQPNNETLKKAAAAIEDSYELQKTQGGDLRRTFYLMAYTVSGQKVFNLNGEQYRTVGELAEHFQSVLKKSTKNFENLCHSLIDYNGNLDCQLETWLIALGKQDQLDTWKKSLNE